MLLAIVLFGISCSVIARVTTSETICTRIESDSNDWASKRAIDRMLAASKSIGVVVGVAISNVTLRVQEGPIRSQLRTRAERLFTYAEKVGSIGSGRHIEFIEDHPDGYKCAGHDLAIVIEFVYQE